MNARVTRNRVVQRWGTPQETVGSVNEPRTMEEHGLRFNEKWTYRAPRGETAIADSRRVCERIIYWERYDFVASFVVVDAGTLEREDLDRVLAHLDDRRYLPPLARSATVG